MSKEKAPKFFTSTVIVPEGTGTQSGSIDLGSGWWEITNLHVILGGGVTVAVAGGASLHGSGSVRWETKDHQDGGNVAIKAAPRLMIGQCTLLNAMVMQGTRYVKGEGRIRSYIELPESVEHTMTATYRRIKDED